MNLSDYRHLSHYTQEDVADRLGVSTTTVSNWETGVMHPTFENLQKLADLYDTSFSNLVETVFRDMTPRKNKDFPGFLFTDLDEEYLRGLRFSSSETEMIRWLAVSVDRWGDDILSEFNPSILSQLPAFYLQERDLIITNQIASSVWHKFVSNRNSAQQAMFPYSVVWDYVKKFLLVDVRGQDVVAFSIEDMPFDRLTYLADDMEKWRTQMDDRFLFPKYHDIALAVTLTKERSFDIREFVSHRRFKALKNAELDVISDDELFEFVFFGDLFDWITMDGDGNGTVTFSLTERGQDFYDHLDKYEKDSILRDYREWKNRQAQKQ